VPLCRASAVGRLGGDAKWSGKCMFSCFATYDYRSVCPMSDLGPLGSFYTCALCIVQAPGGSSAEKGSAKSTSEAKATAKAVTPEVSKPEPKSPAVSSGKSSKLGWHKKLHKSLHKKWKKIMEGMQKSKP